MLLCVRVCVHVRKHVGGAARQHQMSLKSVLSLAGLGAAAVLAYKVYKKYVGGNSRDYKNKVLGCIKLQCVVWMAA